MDEDEDEDEVDPFAPSKPSIGFARGSSPNTGFLKKAKALARELTEPIDPQVSSSQTPLARHTGFFEIGQSLSTLARGSNYASIHPATPQRHTLSPSPLNRTPSTAPSWLSMSQRDPESQDSDAWIDTPLVTPNGSLQWRVTDTSAIPASQLDAESQLTVAENVTFSQLGFTPNQSQLPEHPFDDPTDSPGASSSHHTTRPTSPSPVRPSGGGRTLRSPLRAVFEPTPAPPARYNFRDRANPQIAPMTAVTNHSRSRSPSLPRDRRSTSLSPHRLSPQRSPRHKGKRTSQSVRPVRRSARHARKAAGLDGYLA